MKTRITLLLLLVALLFEGQKVFSQTVEKSVFTEEFKSDNDLNWPVGTSATYIGEIKNSNYYYEHISDDMAAFSAREIPAYIPDNHAISTSIKLVEGTGHGYGIIFGYLNSSNFHKYNISSRGYYQYGYYEEGEYHEPIGWTETTKINNGQFNSIKVEFEGDQISFFINNLKVQQMAYKGAFGPKMGFIVYNKQKIEVDHLDIISKQKVEAQQPITTVTIEKDDETGLPSLESAYAGYKNKYALVVGNSNYIDMPLKNPKNDAMAISNELEAVGFTVIKIIDADRQKMRQGIREFSDYLMNNPGVGLFYYAGHGLQANGINYLMPVDAVVEREYEIEDECIRADLVLRMLSNLENPMNVIILDACRNNPFARSSRSAARGLAQPQSAPTGSIIAFATAPGRTASDGDGENGLYTQELIKAMKEPGLSIEQVFKRVRINVSNISDGDQIPWENSSLMGDFYFRKD